MKDLVPRGPLAFWVLGLVAGAAFAPRGGPGLSEEERRMLAHMRWVEIPDGNGGCVKTIRFEGVDVQIVNGLGATDATDGSGNLIVGYNETGSRYGDVRSGSHNLIVGAQNSYSSYGGIAAAHGNAIAAPFACVTGGEYNCATGYAAAVVGGFENGAEGGHSTVTAGKFNRAAGQFATVSGGHLNVASGMSAAVSAGFTNLASGNHASVTGGVMNKACGEHASVSGGLQCILNKSHDWGAGAEVKDF